MSNQFHRRVSESAGLTQDAALLDRVRKLGSLLPVMAQDVAVARREAASLRRENQQLKRQLVELVASASGHTSTGAIRTASTTRRP